MKKSTKYVLGVILLFAIAAYMFIPKDLQLPSGALGTGISPLSVQQISITSTDPQLQSNNTYLITGVADLSGGEVIGTFGLNEENKLSSDKRFTIKVRLENHQCDYRIKTTKEADFVSLYYYSGSASSSVAGQKPNQIGFMTGTSSAAHILDIGDIYLLDSTNPIPASKLNITIQIEGEPEQSVLLENNNKVAQIGNLARFTLVGDILSENSCPLAQNDIAVMRLNRGFEGNPFNVLNFMEYDKLYIKDRTAINNLLNFYKNVLYATSNFDTVAVRINEYNTLSNAIVATQPSITNCQILPITENSVFSCKPPVTAKPLITMYVNADKVGIHTPVGKPQLGNTVVDNSEALQYAIIKQDITNIGMEADTFEVSLTCPSSLQVSPTKTQLGVGEQKTTELQAQGFGVIETCQITAKSVNKPANNDSKLQKITVYPFCDKTPKPLPFVKQYSSELGCVYVCGNIYNYDINENNCGKIETYDRCIYENTTCLRKGEFAQSFHCVGEGSYMEINDYLDMVQTGGKAFVPLEKSGQIWIGAPYCFYTSQYGYKISNGVAIPIAENFKYDSSKAIYPEARLVQGAVSNITEVNTGTEAGSTGTIPIEQQDNLWLYVVAGLGLGAAAYYIAKKR